MAGDLVPERAQMFQTGRSSGRLPAMSAALIAPIGIPATQSGKYSDDANASYTPAW
jgi:hypothetical protein